MIQAFTGVVSSLVSPLCRKEAGFLTKSQLLLLRLVESIMAVGIANMPCAQSFSGLFGQGFKAVILARVIHETVSEANRANIPETASGVMGKIGLLNIGYILAFIGSIELAKSTVLATVSRHALMLITSYRAIEALRVSAVK